VHARRLGDLVAERLGRLDARRRHRRTKHADPGIPQGIVSALNAGIARAQESPEVKTRLAELGAEPAGVSPEACAEFVRSEIAKWAPVVKASGATAD